MKRLKQSMVLVFLLLGINNIVIAASQSGATVMLTGMEANGLNVYVGISPNPNGCLYGGVYFYEPTELDKALSVALAAKMSGKTVRIDFSQSASNGQCLGVGIYVE